MWCGNVVVWWCLVMEWCADVDGVVVFKMLSCAFIKSLPMMCDGKYKAYEHIDLS